jgi:hypothetical protein
MPDKRHNRILNDKKRLDVLHLAQLASLNVKYIANDGHVVPHVRRGLEDLDIGADVGFNVTGGGGAI